jgi:hypothetical protein
MPYVNKVMGLLHVWYSPIDQDWNWSRIWTLITAGKIIAMHRLLFIWKAVDFIDVLLSRLFA